MKSKIAVACIAATLIIIFISCKWFGAKPRSEAFNLQGTWSIDSIANKGSDSANQIGMLALAVATKDSLPPGIQFNADSSFQYTGVKDSVKGKYYLSPDETSLFIREDSLTHQFNFIEKSDSAVSFASVDSVFYYLKRR